MLTRCVGPKQPKACGRRQRAAPVPQGFELEGFGFWGQGFVFSRKTTALPRWGAVFSMPGLESPGSPSPRHVILYYIILYDVILYYIILCYIILHFIILCYWRLRVLGNRPRLPTETRCWCRPRLGPHPKILDPGPRPESLDPSRSSA